MRELAQEKLRRVVARARELVEAAPWRPLFARRERRVAWGLGAPVLALLTVFAIDRIAHAGCALRGVWVSGVALSGLARSESREALSALGARLERTPLRVRLGGEVFELDPGRVRYRLSVEATETAALERGRQGGFFAELAWWLRRWRSVDEVVPRASLDNERLAEVLSSWEESALPDRPFQGGVAVQDGRLVAVYPRRGRGVELALAERLLLDALGRERRSTLELPTRSIEPRLGPVAVDAALERAQALIKGPVELVHDESQTRWRFEAAELAEALRTRATADLSLELELAPVALQSRFDEIEKRLEAVPEDAKLEIDERDRVRVVPSRLGAVLDAGKVAQALMHAAFAPARLGELPVATGAPPAFQTDDALALGITGLVARFTTFHACCQPRVHNIHRIADLLNGTIVRPGETLSVNAVVGERTLKNGFVMAPSIEDGEMVDALGGGISQFATTFFNAVFHGGYDIIERQPHTYWFPRYPMGHEATLSYPKPDIIFKNDTAAGLLIKTVYTDTSISVKLFGDNGGRKIRAEVSPRFDVVEPPVELIADESILPDEEKVDESGMIGWSVTVARLITFSDGTTKQEKRKVTYKPRTRRVRVHACRIPEGEPGHTGEKCPELDAGTDGG